MKKNIILIGNTSGIGEATTKKFLQEGHSVWGISRSLSEISHPNYKHTIQDVAQESFKECLSNIILETLKVDVCIYFAGIGDVIDWSNLSKETNVFEVNLMGAVICTEVIVSKMLEQGFGHFIGLSSVVDGLISQESPSYSASKSGVSKYWEGLGLGIPNKEVHISNIRFGFVDTKMAKAPVRPFMLSVDSASNFILKVIEKPRVRATRPFMILPLVWLIGLPARIRLLLGS